MEVKSAMRRPFRGVSLPWQRLHEFHRGLDPGLQRVVIVDFVRLDHSSALHRLAEDVELCEVWLKKCVSICVEPKSDYRVVFPDSNRDVAVEQKAGPPAPAPATAQLLLVDVSLSGQGPWGDLIVAFQPDVAVDETLPHGGYQKFRARMPVVAAYMCVMALTLGERKQERDSCRSYLLCRGLTGRIQELARDFRGKMADKLIAEEGMYLLRERFERLDSFSPVWAAQTAI
ncbi:MAG: hypothetical protein JSS02_17815 [Planctomycetes bacterium]|nr:hypothetical protein [Planctomycetota bacterium]